MAKHQSPVIRSLASSNTWLIGLLLILGSIVVITLYNYSSYKAVKGVATKVADLKPHPTSGDDNGTRLSNGCFVLKGNLVVLNSCGTGLYRNVQYTCGDNTKISLGSSTSCRSVANWLTTIALSCKGHTSCDVKATPSASPSRHPDPTHNPTGRPIKNISPVTNDR